MIFGLGQVNSSNAGVLRPFWAVFFPICPLRSCLRVVDNLYGLVSGVFRVGRGPGFLPDEAKKASLWVEQSSAGSLRYLDLDFHWLNDWRRHRNRLHGCFILS